MATPHEILTKPMILGAPSNERWEPPALFVLDGWRFSAASCRGIGYKERNEDRIAVVPSLPLVAVIDGMGGLTGGEQAAQILAEELTRLRIADEENLRQRLFKASERMAIECLRPEAGACFVALWWDQTQLSIAYAGDVKLIVMDYDHHLLFETRDHSLVNAWIETGELAPAQALNHPQRHIVTKALTGTSGVDFELIQIPYQPSCQLMIASDGWWDNFTVEETLDMMTGQDPAHTLMSLMPKALQKMAASRSGRWDGIQNAKPDNLSLLIGDCSTMPY